MPRDLIPPNMICHDRLYFDTTYIQHFLNDFGVAFYQRAMEDPTLSIHFDKLSAYEDVNSVQNGYVLFCWDEVEYKQKSDLIPMDDINSFFNNKEMRIKIYKTNGNTIVIETPILHKNFSYILALMPRLVPHLYTTPLTDEEIKLYFGVRDGDYAELRKEQSRILQKYRNEIQYKRINRIFSEKNSSALRNLKADISNIQRSINSYYSTIANWYSEIRKKENEIIGFENSSAEKIKEMIEKMSDFKNVDIEEVNADSYVVGVHTKLKNIDDMAYECLRNNLSSWLNTSLNQYAEKDEIIKILDAIILDQTLDMKMCAFYEIIPYSSIVPITSGSYYSNYLDEMPNMHIRIHGCLGQYRTDLSQFAGTMDIESLYSTLVLSASSMNVEESASFNPLIRGICADKTAKIYYSKKHGDLNFNEAIDLIEKGEL